MSDVMCRIFARLILSGRKTLDEVPESGRDKVKALVEAETGE